MYVITHSHLSLRLPSRDYANYEKTIKYPGVNFTKVFTQNFYPHKSQKRKNSV